MSPSESSFGPESPPAPRDSRPLRDHSSASESPPPSVDGRECLSPQDDSAWIDASAAGTGPDDPPRRTDLSLLEQCQQVIQYQFRDERLLTAALTHASGAQHRLASNERLEFLGDSILGVVVCEHLFHNYPNLLEGQLTKIKSAVVSRHTCVKISRSLGLESFLIVGKGISADKPVPPSLLADVFESMVAAIYLDGGAEAARSFVERYTIPEIMQAASGETDENFKSLLQQLVQRDLGDTPSYQLVEERGPDHDKWFCVAARFDHRDFQAAWGRNKKEAEQRAAGNALAQLSGLAPPFLEPPAGMPNPPLVDEVDPEALADLPHAESATGDFAVDEGSARPGPSRPGPGEEFLGEEFLAE